jgi:hypothetical protein
MRSEYGLSGYLKKWKHRTMDYAEAKKQVAKTFLSLDYSVPIYREDNLDLISSLEGDKKKEFYRKRYVLSKKAIKASLDIGNLTKIFKTIF